MAPASRGAQPVVTIPDAVSCRTCRLEIRPQFDLVVPAEIDWSSRHPARVRVDASGRFWVFASEGSLPALFAPDGRFLQLVGRPGRGPGEFAESFDVLVATRESLLVLDSGTRRATLLDARLRAVRFLSMPHPLWSAEVVHWPASLVANSSGGGSSRSASDALQLVRADARALTLVRSFGPADGELAPGETGFHAMSLSPPAGETLWSAGRSAYNLYQWSIAGTLLRTLRRRPAWFPGDVSPNPWTGTPTRAPPPKLVGVSSSGPDVLWAFVLLPGEQWRSAWPPLPSGTREISTGALAMDRLHRTRLEAIDPASGRVLAWVDHPHPLVNPLPGGRFASFAGDPDGSYRVQIFSATLTR